LRMRLKVYGARRPAYESNYRLWIATGIVGRMRIAVRVRPGSSRERVGGRYDGPSGPALVVAVTAPAIDGRATAAVLEAVAKAFGVRRRAVLLVSGPASRDKVLDVDADEQAVSRRLAELLS
jgi:uncharacterized protein YggU (UPF0235/DUF167 family)